MHHHLKFGVNLTAALLLAAALPLSAQMRMGNPANGPTKIPDHLLDPARSLSSAELEGNLHKPVPTHYVWTKADAVPPRPRVANGWSMSEKTDLGPHYFRDTFNLSKLPEHATLYIAGPRTATIYLNGQQVGRFSLNLDFPIAIRVYERDVTHALRVGKNVIAIEAVRGPHDGNGAANRLGVQQTRGQVLAVKIVPAVRGVVAAPLMMTDANWKGTMKTPPAGWQEPGFNDASWPAVDDLGGLESSINFFQWNADAGMYAWPGYDGISPFLAQYPLKAMRVKHVYPGLGEIENAQALGNKGSGEMTVTLPAEHVALHDAPQVLLDFGREVTGRLELQSTSNEPAEVTVQYGESQDEAIKGPWLGIDPVYIPAHGTAYGPKSAFRYAVVRFTGGRDTTFKTIRLDGIAYPVKYQGWFESNDPLVNKMWTVGAYTAHLCMQDGIWDAPKRDRGRWMGDLDVSGRTIDDVFADHFLMADTMSRLLGPNPVLRHVDGIPGYSAFWLTGEKAFYLHTGSMKQLESVHVRMVQLLNYMEKDLNEQNVYSDLTHAWSYVDWSPDMHGYTPETRMATQAEYYAAFQDGAYLLRVLHDNANAAKFQKKAEELKAAGQKYLLDAQGSFGTRWQPNAYAVVSGMANPDQYGSIWKNALGDVGHVKHNPYIITPYYNDYVIRAMAKMGHRKAAMNWIRQYWGGMINEGATSYWEGYDPSWYKGYDFHESLQADNTTGFHTSLAHGWSSGVTPWLMRQVLGIEPTAGGFAKVNIRPDLIDLQWAKGGEPTPHGMLNVSIRKDDGYVTKIELPADVAARVSVPVAGAHAQVTVNGKPMKSTPAEGGKRAVVMLSGQGTYTVRSR
jgi:hypothetical protein